MNRLILLAAWPVVFVFSLPGAAQDTEAVLDQSAEADPAAVLMAVLSRAPVEAGGVGPGTATTRIEVSGEALLLRESLDHERSGTGFFSEAEKVSRFYLEDIDPDSVTVRLDPPRVYAATYSNAKRIVVTRSETKRRVTGEETEEWVEKDRFVTSFISIPLADAHAGEDVADALRDAAERATPNKKERRKRRK